MHLLIAEDEIDLAEALTVSFEKNQFSVDAVHDGFDAYEYAMAAEYDAIAFGCPAMGAEVLEESEFQPMFDDVKPQLKGKKIALFGSYGWGDGEWMRSWEEDCLAAGAVLACDSVICQDEPDGDALAACEALGKALAE